MKTVLFVSLLISTLSMNAPLNVAWPTPVPARENAQEKKSVAYLFPAFVKGVVYFRNGTKSEAFLNYYYQDGQMRFLNPRADTLLFTGKYLIDYVAIGDRRFVLTDTHSDMEVIGEGGRVRLAARTQPEIAGNSLSYSGQHFSASEGNAAQVQMVTSQGGHVQWQNNASGHRWRMKTSYFLIDQNRVVHAASRRAFLHVYGRNRRQLTRYLRENRIDFGHADDLQRLFGFCSSLTSL
ncbi:hypothetical protein J2Y45_005885 [Dyadobacter sp. BE34]|uniref:Uncharacterized protein n=1 Tax=Dyadobacter fermentans TaxID=94254 RepID=A0ABU1R5P4_9BACT|nr:MULTISPECIES: hypothetical protein [Dyadobacter]MDR6808673.1 hypothetical protein [Dyadobacter fermentans]MDR7046416.1 hypothetical protein [Dyadobacter sp. BE242]MDR7200729.1 hypothetical protein [Dyadobacter sp. BE34]MDR7218689.1 hypothetical protein [Dyadobacter sp. BE31]MDR7266619.1 hypothetical protein [Dyadobacter sp. BE32]